MKAIVYNIPKPDGCGEEFQNFTATRNKTKTHKEVGVMNIEVKQAISEQKTKLNQLKEYL